MFQSSHNWDSTCVRLRFYMPLDKCLTPFLSAPVRCLYCLFYLWILFSSHRIRMEISKILMAAIVAATLISQTQSASLKKRVTDVIPQKTANATQRVWMSYLVRFPRWSHYSQLKVIKLILTEIAILEIYSTYLTYKLIYFCNYNIIVLTFLINLYKFVFFILLSWKAHLGSINKVYVCMYVCMSTKKQR